MPTIDLGNIKFNWRGIWSSSTSYVVDDVVYVDPHSYVCVQNNTGQGVTTNGNNSYWNIMASGANLPGQSGYAGKALVTNGSSISWGNGGQVVTVNRRRFNSHHSYGGNGTHITVYDWTVSGLTPGNRLIFQFHMAGEAHNDTSLRCLRNGNTWLYQGLTDDNDGGHPYGMYNVLHDSDNNSTPNLGMWMFYDDVVSSSHTYQFYKYGNGGGSNWHVNRCWNRRYERGVTTQILWEIAG